MAKESQEGVTVRKDKDFSEWYTQVITKADLADYSPVSGCIIFKPYAYAIWEKIVSVVDGYIKAMGVQNAYFPLFIPEKLLNKEKAHVEGFSPEVAWVTHAGKSKLEERLAIRPTSETIMYDAYANWIRSWRDLPLRLNQWNSVVRWEFKHPVPFLRTREFLWNEGHTAFATQKEAEKECMDILRMYEKVLRDYLALYAQLGKKTEKEKFAGAEYSLSSELFMPNGKAIQGPDSHHDGQNFAKAFDIQFLDKQEKKQYVWQNTWAITTRVIGIMIAVHGDDKGLVLPPAIAPHKIVVVPIVFKKGGEIVLKKAKAISEKLKKYDVVFDDRDYSPGWKFNEWELKGIPLRIEIGPNDLKKKQVVLVRRDTGKKAFVKEGKLLTTVENILQNMQTNLYKQSQNVLKKNIVKAKAMNDLVKAIKAKKFVEAFWCGEQNCEEKIKEKADGSKILNIPFEQPKSLGNCVCCSKKSKWQVVIAKSY